MKTKNIKVGGKYICNNEIVFVIRKIKGTVKRQRNMQSGQVFTGHARTKKKFMLSNGLKVDASKLTLPTNNN